MNKRYMSKLATTGVTYFGITLVLGFFIVYLCGVAVPWYTQVMYRLCTFVPLAFASFVVGFIMPQYPAKTTRGKVYTYLISIGIILTGVYCTSIVSTTLQSLYTHPLGKSWEDYQFVQGVMDILIFMFLGLNWRTFITWRTFPIEISEAPKGVGIYVQDVLNNRLLLKSFRLRFSAYLWYYWKLFIGGSLR